MKKEDYFATEMNEEEKNRTVIMNGEKMELGSDGEYHVVKGQFGRLSKLHAIGACCAGICILLAVMAIGAVALTEPKSLSETAEGCEYSDEICRDVIGAKDPEILSLTPDEVDPGDPDKMPEPSYNMKGDLSKLYEEGVYYYEPNPEPAPKNPELDPVNQSASSTYMLTIRCVDQFGNELRPPQIVQMQAGETFSESVPVVSGHHPEMSEITGIMPEHDLDCAVRYFEKPVNLPSPSDKE